MSKRRYFYDNVEYPSQLKDIVEGRETPRTTKDFNGFLYNYASLSSFRFGPDPLPVSLKVTGSRNQRKFTNTGTTLNLLYQN